MSEINSSDSSRNAIQILTSLKNDLLKFLDQLILLLPDEGDLIIIRYFIADKIPINDIMEYIVSKLLPLNDLVKNKNDNFFLQNNASYNYGIIGVVSANGTATGDVYALGYSPSAGSSMTPVLNWTSGGNVGIGTTSPLQTSANRTVLTINGTSSAISNFGINGTLSGYIYADASSFGFYSQGDIYIDAAGSKSIILNTNSSERLKVTSEGYLGTTVTSTTVSSGDLLGVLSFVSKDASTYSSGGITNIRSYATSTYNTGNVSGDLRFYVSSSLQNTTGSYLFGTEAMRITSEGRVGIQTTAPQGLLEVGVVDANSTYGGHFFSTFTIPINTWSTVFYAPNNNWAAITEFTWTSAADYNRSGAAYMRWAYNAGSNALGVVWTLFNDSQNSTATFRQSGGEIQVLITGGAANYYVQVRIQGSKAA